MSNAFPPRFSSAHCIRTILICCRQVPFPTIPITPGRSMLMDEEHVSFRHHFNIELIDLHDARVFLMIERAGHLVRFLTGLHSHTNQAGEIARIGSSSLP